MMKFSKDAIDFVKMETDYNGEDLDMLLTLYAGHSNLFKRYSADPELDEDTRNQAVLFDQTRYILAEMIAEKMLEQTGHKKSDDGKYWRI